MFKSAYEKIKKLIIIALLTIVIIAPIWASVQLGVIQFVNTEHLAAISFNKRMFTNDE